MHLDGRLPNLDLKVRLCLTICNFCEVSSFLLVHEEHEKLVDWLDFMLRPSVAFAFSLDISFGCIFARQLPTLGIRLPSKMSAESSHLTMLKHMEQEADDLPLSRHPALLGLAVTFHD